MARVVLAEANATGAAWRRRRCVDRAMDNLFAKREICAMNFRWADQGDPGSPGRRFLTGCWKETGMGDILQKE
jgi:hypothetical protein